MTAAEAAANGQLEDVAPDECRHAANPKAARQPSEDKASDAGARSVRRREIPAGLDSTDAIQIGPVVLAMDADEPRADTRVLARHLGLHHRNVFAMVNDHRTDFEELGVVRFQTAKPLAGSVGGRPERFALLSEDQAFLLLTFSRNTGRVRSLKVRLVKAFGEVRRGRDLWVTEYLPSYHALHDEIAELSGGSKNEKFVHMNVNKLVNKAVGINAGTRGRLPTAGHSLLVVAQTTAARAMHGATDHHDGYARAKSALDRLGGLLIGTSS